MPEVDQHVAPMEEEPYSDDEYQGTDSDDEYQGTDPDDLLSKFKEKLSYHRPTSYSEPWVFWSPTDHSSCLPPPDSVGIKDKIKSVLLELWFEKFDDPLLIQFWAAITTGGQCSLTTSEQPFALFGEFFEQKKNLLCSYRNNSVPYKFFVDAGSEEEVGFPVSVFRQQLLESTPDVRYYSIKQHPWCGRDRDFRYDHMSSVRYEHMRLSLLALPVFDPSGKCCAGVLELVGSNYYLPHHQIDEVICKALEAVDLKCLGRLCNHFDEEIPNKALQPALDEIKDVLQVVCETHKLPLAQTWVPCKQCSEAISSFGNKSPRVTLSNINDAHYCENFRWFEEFLFFQQLQLQEDQGVVGRAYLCRNSSFCRDITQFSLTEYPMVYWARYYKLFGCFAICLKSSYTGENRYILEFFFPEDERIYEHPPPQILDSILETMKQHFRTFKVASGEPLGKELFVEFINNGRDIGRNFDDVAKSFNVSQSTFGPHLKIDKVNYPLSNMEPACSNMPHVTKMQDVKTVDIKAAYKGTLIRFKLPPTAGMVKLEEEIVKRLTFLQVGCFKVTYLDEENDSILLACDTDLQDYINTSIASGITKIRMFIEPETNRQP